MATTPEAADADAIATTTPATAVPTTTEQTKDNCILTIFDIPIYFHDDWNVGIGGGLWSTGRALCEYFGTEHAVQSLRRLHASCCRGKRGLRIVELGSGNGVLAVCLAACATAHKIPIDTLVVTDLADHVPLMQATVAANPAALGTTHEIRVQEYIWGDDTASTTLPETAVTTSTSSESSPSFDIVLGSDVAYGEECYDDLLRSLQTLTHATTGVALIGFTLMDTRPYFFDRMVVEYGLTYRKLSDHVLESAFRGTTFGVFAIQHAATSPANCAESHKPRR